MAPVLNCYRCDACGDWCLSASNYRCVIVVVRRRASVLRADHGPSLTVKGAGSMPSVPQSLLWISLVVLWLFVLVPMLISKRDAVRRTSDVALATRVLNSGAAVRKLKKFGPAAGHRSDPDWQPVDDEPDVDEQPSKAVVKANPAAAEDDYLDVEVVEDDSGALPAAGGEAEEPVAEPVAQEEPSAPEVPEEDEGTAAEYETVEDTSGLESEVETPTTATPAAGRRRLYESTTAAKVSARKYRFRRRMLSAMALVIVVTTVTALTVWPAGWWACGLVGTVTILYLAYLRRQTRIEERLRRRRMQRMARARVGVQNTEDRGFDVVPSRLRQPGAVVLEIDDEDPAFEHLDRAQGPMEYHLPRASGQ